MVSSPSKLIVVIGATGAQGGSVLDTYLGNPEYKIRAITRNVNSSKAQALAAKSPKIEVVAANLSDPASLSTAFHGATSIFAVTDWMGIYQDPAVQSATPPNGMSLNHYACTIETEQARNVFDTAANIPTLERLVFSTLAHISKLSHGKYTHGYNFDSKALAVEYLQSSHPNLWKKTSLIQMGVYLENFVGMSLFKPFRDAETGVITFETLGSQGTQWPWPFIAADEDTGKLVQMLIDRLPAQTHLVGERQLLPYESLGQILEEVTGEKVIVKYDKKLEGIPDSLKQQFEDVFAFLKDFGYWGGDETVVLPENLGLGLKLGTVKDWVEKQDWAAILQ